MGGYGSGKHKAAQDVERVMNMAVEEAVNRDEQYRRQYQEGHAIHHKQRKQDPSLHHQNVIVQDEEPSADDLAVYPNIEQERQEYRRGNGLLKAARERATMIREGATKAARSIPKHVMAKAIAKVEKQGHMGPTGIRDVPEAAGVRAANDPVGWPPRGSIPLPPGGLDGARPEIVL